MGRGRFGLFGLTLPAAAVLRLLQLSSATVRVMVVMVVGQCLTFLANCGFCRLCQSVDRSNMLWIGCGKKKWSPLDFQSSSGAVQHSSCVCRSNMRIAVAAAAAVVVSLRRTPCPSFFKMCSVPSGRVLGMLGLCRMTLLWRVHGCR